MVPLLVVIYLFPYEMLNINLPVFEILNTNIPLVNIIVLIIFTMASITDYFDGKIARKEQIITTFGKFADPIADKLLVNTILLILANNQDITIIIPIIMIARDTIVDAIRLIAASNQNVIAASQLGKIKTVSQMVAVILLLLCNFPFSYIGIPMDKIAIWIAVIISVVSGIDYFLKNKSMLTESM
jgi:CDP-diacylglycerol--glycerol-3-phosphate 3-phosphatidyltransferase